MAVAGVSVVDQVSAAMSVSGLQHQVIASNIANRDTQKFQRMKVRFENAMDQAAGAVIVTEEGGASVSLEQDLIALSSNTMRYESLARVLSSYFSILAAISNPNRG